MGEARRKLDADARGISRPRDNRCPACSSTRVHILATAKELARWGVDTDWQGCLACKAVWEPFPESYVRDPVCAEPCDNCAFRPGSPEQRDTAGWRNLIDKLKPGAEEDYGWLTTGGRFFCHKNVPIDLSKGPGNFLFPQRPIVVDGEPVGTTEDITKMRTCSGFLRMVWARAAKAADRTAGAK